jgi:hypothetical protein
MREVADKKNLRRQTTDGAKRLDFTTKFQYKHYDEKLTRSQSRADAQQKSKRGDPRSHFANQVPAFKTQQKSVSKPFLRHKTKELGEAALKAWTKVGKPTLNYHKSPRRPACYRLT